MWGIIGTALSFAHSAFDSYTVVSTGKRQPMKLIGWCVFFMKRTACAVRAPSHSSLTGWLLSGLLSFSPLWLEPGNANDEKLLFPLFLRTYPCCFQVESRQSWAEAIQQSQPALWCCVCTQDGYCALDFSPTTNIISFCCTKYCWYRGKSSFWRIMALLEKCSGRQVAIEISSKLIYYF